MLRIVAAVAALAAVASLAPATVSASEDEPTIQLAFVNPHAPEVDRGEARQLFADVNAARIARGLRPLVQDRRLERLALAVAHQMAQRHYFGHTDPDGVTFADRVRASGFRCRFAAENLAFDEDESHANQAFLRSSPHYANIVAREPRRLGTAVVAAGNGQVFYVEEFSD